MDPADPLRSAPAKLREGLNELVALLALMRQGVSVAFGQTEEVLDQMRDVVDQLDGGGA